MTLIEIIAASVVIAVVLTGTMTAFITAARIVGKENLFALAEANGLLRQTADQLRNAVYKGNPTLGGMADGNWHKMEDINTPDLPNGKRCLKAEDQGNYYEVRATVCWNNDPACATCL